MPEVAVFGLSGNDAGEIAIRSPAPIRKLVERCEAVVAGPAMSDAQSAARLTRHLLRSCGAQIVLDAFAYAGGGVGLATGGSGDVMAGIVAGLAGAGLHRSMQRCGPSGYTARPVGAVPNRSVRSAFSPACSSLMCPASCAACNRQSSLDRGNMDGWVEVPGIVVIGTQRGKTLCVQVGELAMNRSDLFGVRIHCERSLFGKPLPEIFEVGNHVYLHIEAATDRFSALEIGSR